MVERARASASGDALVFLAYNGHGERVIQHDELGIAYAFNPTTPSWVPASLANRLLKTEPRAFSIAQPEPAFETLGGA